MISNGIDNPITVEAEQSTTPQSSVTQRPQRERIVPRRFADSDVYSDDQIGDEGELIHMVLLAGMEPISEDEALAQPIWRNAMQEELRSIEKNETWTLVDPPANKHCIGVKWVFKTKLNPDGSVSKHKARLVAKGFLQQKGVDFSEVFAPVARIETIRLVIAVACAMKWPLFQLDVKSAFLHGSLDEEVYVQQPPGFTVKGKEHQVFRLRKALYGLKQALRAWNKRIDSFFSRLKFIKCTVEHGVYVKGGMGEDMIIICLYVDDLLVTGSNLKEINEFKQIMEAEFEMTDLGKLSYFLGMEFAYTTKGLVMHQKKYAGELLRKFNMVNCNAAASPIEVNLKLTSDEDGEIVDETLFKQIIGSLRYICNSRPDLSFCVGLISRFMGKPRKTHMMAVKRILRYVQGTTDYGVMFPIGRLKSELELIGYTDSDYCGDLVERKSTSGYLFLLNDAPISWCSKKQSVVALSSCEAEYVAGSFAACQGVWIEELLRELKIVMKTPLQLKIDNVSAINLSKNPVSHGRSKHIEVRYHFLRDLVNKERVILQYCNTEVQLADFLTKALKVDRFEALKKKAGIVSLRDLT